MKLNLTRPLAFIDTETTGANVYSDRIVEISILKIGTDHSQDVKTRLVNPGIPIPKEASRIHGITDADVRDAPRFSEVAAEIVSFIDHCDLAGFNSNRFDIPLIAEEFLRAGLDFDIKGRRLVDVLSIFHRMERRDLSAAYRFYCGKNLENAHSAEADITATYEVLLGQLQKYPELKNDMDFLHEFSSKTKFADLAGNIMLSEKGDALFAFGKHKWKKVEEVFRSDLSYYDWMMKSDFPLYTKKVITEIKNRVTTTVA